MKSPVFTCVAMIFSVFCLAANADDAANNWHQFRGPTGNGDAIQGNPPVAWSSDSAKWKTSIPGRGNSSPIVWGNKIILLTAVETDREQAGAKKEEAQDEQPANGGRRRRFRRPAPTKFHEFLVVCVDRETGNQLWSTKVAEAVPHEAGHNTNTFASGSPVTDGKHIWASFNSFGLYCLDMDGNIKWDRHFGKMETVASFGEGASPALYEGTLVLNWDHQGQSFIEAMDAESGETKWKKDRDERTTWSTPVIVKHKDRVQVITNGANRVRSYDLSNGDLIWECGGQTGNPIPTPMIIDDLAVCMTGWRANAAYGIPLDSSGDITDTDKIAWHRDDVGPYVPTGVLYDGTVYSTKGRNAVLTAINAKTGETIIDATRLRGISSLYASLVAGNGHIYVTGRNGTTLVLKHGDDLEIVETNELGEDVDATPAIVGNQIIIRSHNNLYCFENRG